MSFKTKANAAMKRGELTVRDLQHWFARPYTTVWRWVESGWEPGLPHRAKGRSRAGVKALADLELLERAIAKKLFPVPDYIRLRNRKGYVRDAYHAAGVPQARIAR